jgi:hypothetical protein
MSDLVERVARALFQHVDGRLGPWPDLETRDSYWSEAEAALAAIEAERAKSDFEKNAAILELAARYDAAIDRIDELERALRECAAPFVIGDQDGIRYEDIAREFNRRQGVARAVLEKKP